jgi:hypothetical protein
MTQKIITLHYFKLIQDKHTLTPVSMQPYALFLCINKNATHHLGRFDEFITTYIPFTDIIGSAHELVLVQYV